MKQNSGAFSLTGFAVGIVCCLLLATFIYRQFSFRETPPARAITAAQFQDLQRELAATQAQLNLLQQQMKASQTKPAPHPIPISPHTHKHRK